MKICGTRTKSSAREKRYGKYKECLGVLPVAHYKENLTCEEGEVQISKD